MILNHLHHKCDPTRDEGVVDATTHETLGKLPSVVLVHRYAASKTSIAASNADDKESTIFAVLTSPSMWVTPACDFEALDNLEDEEYTSDSDLNSTMWLRPKIRMSRISVARTKVLVNSS